MHAAHTPQGGVLINSSRSVLFASSGSDFAEAAATEARRLHQEMKANWKGA
jgi:orotidine-5'-phosphate decarboxylase